MKPTIEDWMLEVPALRSGKNKLLIYAYFWYLACTYGSTDIYKGYSGIDKLLELPSGSAKQSIKALLKDGLLVIKKHGRRASKGLKHTANIYELIVPMGDHMAKLKASDLYATDSELIEYINSTKLSDAIKEALRIWVTQVHPGKTAIQLKLMMQELREFCRTEGKTDWNLFLARVNRATANNWKRFVFSEEMDAKIKEGNKTITPTKYDL